LAKYYGDDVISLIHGYFNVDWEIVWGVVSKELGPFRKSIVDILTSEGWI